MKLEAPRHYTPPPPTPLGEQSTTTEAFREARGDISKHTILVTAPRRRNEQCTAGRRWAIELLIFLSLRISGSMKIFLLSNQVRSLRLYHTHTHTRTQTKRNVCSLSLTGGKRARLLGLECYIEIFQQPPLLRQCRNTEPKEECGR